MLLQIICSYLFWPFVFIMGVESVDCPVSARILGIKLNVNEMVAFYELGVVIKNRATLHAYNGTWHWTDGGDIVLDHANTTLVGGVMSVCAFLKITTNPPYRTHFPFILFQVVFHDWNIKACSVCCPDCES